MDGSFVLEGNTVTVPLASALASLPDLRNSGFSPFGAMVDVIALTRKMGRSALWLPSEWCRVLVVLHDDRVDRGDDAYELDGRILGRGAT